MSTFPLLYLIVANALSTMIMEAVNQGRIHGVPIIEIADQYTHGQFVHDTNVIVEAKVEYIQAIFEICRCMGNACGLYVKETDIKVVFIYDQPMLEDIQALGFRWETEANVTKLLGFFIGECISSDRMVQHLAESLEKRLEKARLSPHSLIVRVEIANQFVVSVLGYMTTLYTDTIAQLEQLDMTIKDFVWSGQETGKWPCVDYATITRPEEEGGLGLIFVKHQTMARIAKNMLWMVANKDHTLQWILRAKITNLSEKRWRTRDYTWITSPDKTRPKKESTLWDFHAQVWIIFKKCMVPRVPHTWEEQVNLPLWSPGIMNKNSKEAGCLQVK